ncbi:hypothetical protein TNCV_2509231 [Trichonephila clavipes]|nr:hypothetical protein TNCV_2509231 [Trichonephila clavipes]
MTHFGSPHLNPRNDVLSISFSAIETDKIHSSGVRIVSICFLRHLDRLSGDISRKTQNLIFERCSKDDIAKSDE